MIEKIRQTLKDIEEQETQFYFFIIDLFAKEYGWTIEYIQNLELPEISGLLRAMYKRHNLEDIVNQININKGFSGQIGEVRHIQKRKPEDEIKNLEQLARLLGQKVYKVKK